MKKIFLTSGIILCMACPALATQDIDSNGQITVDDQSTDATCTTEVLSDVSQNGTNAFEAKWTPLTYTIAYSKGSIGGNANLVSDGQSGVPSPTTPVTFDSTSIALANPTDANFTATGYHFAGWESPVNLTNGESPVSPATYVLYQGTQASSPNGYYTGGTLASYGYANTAQNRTVTLAAHWEPNTYTITYDANTSNGGAYASGYSTATTFGPGASTGGATYNAVWTTQTAAAAHIEAQDGYTFSRWDTVADGTGTSYSADTQQSAWTSTSNLTLFAIFNPNPYSITYTCGTPAAGVTATGPTNGVSPQSVTYTQGFDMAAASACTATGYHITGWSCPYFDGSSNGSNTYTAGASVAAYNIADNSSCTGQWAANTTTITYACGSNASSGSVAPGNGSATYGQSFAFAENPSTGNRCIVPTGYTFNGWKCKVGGAGDDLNATALFGNSATSTTTQTAGGSNRTWLYEGDTGGTIACVADITANNITLTWFNDTVANNGTTITPSNSEAESCTYGGTITIPSNQPSKTGYTFSGWHVRTSGGGNQ